MPISFGVLLLSLGVTWLLCLTLNGVLYRGAAARGKEARRATEQRLDRDVAQLRAAVATLQAQLDLRAHDLAEQARELERVSTALESVRNTRMRRDKH